MAPAALLGFVVLLQSVDTWKQQLRDAVATHQIDKAEEAIANLVEKNSESAADALLQCGLASLKSCADLLRESIKLKQSHRRVSAQLRESVDANEKSELRDKLNDLERRLFTLEISAAHSSIIQERLTLALTELNNPKAIQVLLDRLQNAPEAPLRQLAALALSLSPQGDFNLVTGALLDRLKKEKVPNVIIALTEGLRKRRDKRPEVAACLVELLKSEYWQVVVTAAAFLGEIEDPSSVPALIDTLERTEGRVRCDVHQALVRITGVQRTDDPETWKSWWKQNGEKFLGGRYVPTPADKGDPSRRGEFFGLPLTSRSVIFLLDRSDSMREEIKWTPTDDDRSVFDQISVGGKTKLDIAKFQMKKALLRLPAKSRFNIVFYNDAARVFSEEMIALDDRSRKKAFEFIDSIQPGGATDLYGGLGIALASLREPEGLLRKDAADTFFVLSDGLPNAGQVTSADRILNQLWTQNVINRVDIHTVYLGQEQGKGLSLLKDMAQRNNGQFMWPGH
jgi:HEAT repeat protein